MSDITLETFLAEFAKDLGIDNMASIPTVLGEIPQFDSMGKITISLTIERLFGFQIAYDVLDKAETIQALYEYCDLSTQ